MQNATPASAAEIQILGLKVHQVGVPEVHDYMHRVIRAQQKALVLNLNIHCVNLAYKNEWLRQFLNSAQMVFCDGDGVRWGIRLLGHQPPPKITYASWIYQLAEFCEKENFSFYFLGGKPGVAEKAGKQLQTRYPNLKIAGTRDGYFAHEGPENEKVIEEINRLKPDILIMGLGMPLQEKWLQKNWQRVEAKIFLTGGAVFDYTSGNLKRAPAWMLSLHLEWLFRFFQEPKRLFSRYIVGNPLFLMRVLKERFSGYAKN